VGSVSLIEEIKGLSIILFAQILQLLSHVTEHSHSVDRFVIIVPSFCLDQLLNDAIYLFDQARQVYVYYDSDNDLRQDEDRLQTKHNKLRFCYKRNLSGLLQSLKVETASSASESNYQATVCDAMQSNNQRLLAKRSTPAAHRSTSKRFASSFKYGFSVKNIDQVDTCYICQLCQLLFRDPHQLECGDRICKSCIKTENR
jgi:hypothetical protein